MITFAKINEIVWAKANRSYTLFYLNNGDTLMLAKPLNHFEKILSKKNKNFCRIHKTHLINLEHINYHNGSYVMMDDHSKIPLSRRRKHFLLDKLKKANTFSV